MNKILHSKILGEGKPLIILHGLFGMLDNWQALAKEFACFFETHILDLRNHGRSFHANQHNYEVMTEDLLSYLNAYNLDEVYLIGHSMGGKTAMTFACIYPERVEKLVVVDIAPKYYLPHHQEILSGLNAVEQAKIKSRKDADQILSQYFSESAIRQFLLKNLYWRSSSELTFKFNLKVLSNQIENVGQALHADALFERSTLFIVGQSSNYIKETDVELIESHFPDFEIVEIPNSGHWVHAENPDQFFDKVSRFLIY
jgi:pimeloyl-ACP methyl ester carboxylesterase